ncbi:MAG TPA: glycosyltransferase 87 family protein [Polyangia bacterium]|nr:glycosyltransferase 87 family protein [Polyangia bacterium]
MGRAVPALAAAAAVLAVGLVCATTSLQQDFAAYDAAGAARRAGLDPYVNQVGAGRLWDGLAPFRHSRFLYPPLVADLFRPAAALPYLAAKTAFTLALIAAWLGAAALLTARRTVFLVASALFFPLWRHLERGQIDLVLLLLLALAWRFRRRAWAAGLAMGAAIAIKPAMAGVALIVAALGHVRAAAVAVAALVVVAGLTIAVDGTPRLREYLTQVAPRAALYGEGGTASMLLPDELSPADVDEALTVRDGRAYRTALWDVPATASLPRLLAPEAPSRLTAWLPFAVAFALLVGCARRCSAVGGRAEWLFWGAAVACVVTSPAGWIMGLVLALPLAPALVESWAAATWPRGLSAAAAAGWLGVALPWPVAGVATLGATVLVGVAAAAAIRPPQPAGA